MRKFILLWFIRIIEICQFETFLKVETLIKGRMLSVQGQ